MINDKLELKDKKNYNIISFTQDEDDYQKIGISIDIVDKDGNSYLEVENVMLEKGQIKILIGYLSGMIESDNK